MFRSISIFAISFVSWVSVVVGIGSAEPQDVVDVPRRTVFMPRYVVQSQRVEPDLEVYNELGNLDVLTPLFVAHWREQHGVCGEFYWIARQVGFTVDEWPTLRRIIARETGRTCDPMVLNDNAKTGDLSYGLTQINMRGKLGPDRLVRCGLASYEQLWDPHHNLRCARILYEQSGWEPWAYTKPS